MTILHRKIFYMIRHGQTQDNAAGVISGGGRDPHLTDLGRVQAEKAGLAFKHLNPAPARLIVSALIRTHQTGALVAPHLPRTIDARLNERYLGALDGKITEEEQIKRGVLPGEESVADQFARVIESLNAHLEEDAPALFVTHGGTLRRVLEATGLKGKVEAHNGILYAFHPQDAAAWTVAAIGEG